MRFDDFNPDSNSVRNQHQSVVGFLQRQTWTDPAAVSANNLKALTASSASVATTITPTAQPDFARKISVTPGGTTADVKAGSYVLTGTDIRDQAITDTLTFSDNDTLKQVSSKAFKTVTSLLVPIQDGAGATFSIGVEDALGLNKVMVGDNVILTTLDGTYEATRPTVTYDASDISKNTIDPNTALNAAKDLAVVFFTKDIG
jgi:hypothetical protein